MAGLKVEGNAVVVENSNNADGSPAVDRWTFGSAEDAAKQEEQFCGDGVKHRVAAGQVQTQKLSRGDMSALKDAANEQRKQRES